jgi:hypothetical protein
LRTGSAPRPSLAREIYGGTGSDTFVFFALSHSTPSAAGRDTIFGFGGSDVIKLSSIDANTDLAGNQVFSYIGTKGFSDTAGELRYTKTSSGTHVFVDGNAMADFSIHIDSAVSLSQSDFVLLPAKGGVAPDDRTRKPALSKDGAGFKVLLVCLPLRARSRR